MYLANNSCREIRCCECAVELRARRGKQEASAVESDVIWRTR